MVLDNLHGFVIRDGFPISPGHSLIIPRRHIGSFSHLETLEREALFGPVGAKLQFEVI
jgi:diadenosine tetraphosphate (Ap4A) HIT family hydrolase